MKVWSSGRQCSSPGTASWRGQADLVDQRRHREQVHVRQVRADALQISDSIARAGAGSAGAGIASGRIRYSSTCPVPTKLRTRLSKKPTDTKLDRLKYHSSETSKLSDTSGTSSGLPRSRWRCRRGRRPVRCVVADRHVRKQRSKYGRAIVLPYDTRPLRVSVMSTEKSSAGRM